MGFIWHYKHFLTFKDNNKKSYAFEEKMKKPYKKTIRNGYCK